MTVKELITILLDKPMDAEVSLQDKTEHITQDGGKCSGYLFDITEVERWSKYHILINFTDWRADRKTENCSEIPTGSTGYNLSPVEDEPQTYIKSYQCCESCKHYHDDWASDNCDGCCPAHSGYEPKTEPQTERSE